MERLACVDVPALPLQLLLRREPDWANHPAAVIDRDEPQGRILWANERARRLRVLPGRRYAEGLSLAAGLRAGVVDAAEIAAAVDEAVRCLGAFTPAIEPSPVEPGVFWLDAGGLVAERAGRRGLFDSLESWARDGIAALAARRLRAVAVVGFDRFGSYALAKVARGVHVLHSPAEERRVADRVRLDRLRIDPALRDALDRLGVVDVAGLRALPPGGLLARFGAEAGALHRLVSGARAQPLVPVAPSEPVVEDFAIEPDEREPDISALTFLIGQRFGRMRQELARRGEALAALEIELRFEREPAQAERVEPAEPTLDVAQILALVKLRIEALRLPASVTGFGLRAVGVTATRRQLALFAESPRRDLAVANRALARVRAELGADAVLVAETQDNHLPEARFAWRRLTRLAPPEPDRGAPPALVRRILARPLALPDQRPGPDGWLAAGLEAGPVTVLHGPYVISGGWWAGEERHRDYHFAETRRGDVLWLFFDRRRRRWFLHGLVE